MGRIGTRDSRTACEIPVKALDSLLDRKIGIIMHRGKAIHTETSRMFMVVECNPPRMNAKT